MHHKYIFLFTLLFFLAGCWDIDEPDRMDYVHGVGVDYKDGKVIIHLQVANLGSLGTPETVSENESQISIATEKGDNVSSVIHAIYQSAQRKLYFGHDTFMIISEEALKHNLLQESIDIMNRFPETRYRIKVYSTNTDVKDLLKVTTIFQETPILTRITDLENTYEQNSLIRQISLRELIIDLNEPSYDGIIPAIVADKSTWETEENPLNMIKTIGVALVKPDVFNGFILDDDVNGLRWNEKSIRNNVTIYKDGKSVSDVVVVKPKQKYDIKVKNDRVTFHLKIKAKAIINEMIRDENQEFIIKETEQTIKDELKHTFLLGLQLNADVYRLSEHLYRRNLKVWKKLEHKGVVPLDEKSLIVDVSIDLVDASIDKTEPTIE